MIFPIGDDQVRGGHFPVFSYGFIGLNIIIFLFEATMSEESLGQFVDAYGTIPNLIMQGDGLFTLLTYMFLHGGWMHLIGNMLFLWVFADNIEATVGSTRFLGFYLLGGIVATAAHIYFNVDSAMPMVGASGAISAVMGAYIVMYPHSRIKVLFLIFPFRVSAWIFLGLWILQQWISGISSLDGLHETGVAWWAHIGGFAFGVAMGLFFRKSGILAELDLGETGE